MKALALTCILAGMPSLVFAQTEPSGSHSREATDVYIRRLAGLEASSADGEIRIIDVGHLPMSTMLSIVARRGAAGWRVSYACAASPHCADAADHLALAYDVGAANSREVDALLAKLKGGADPGGTHPSATLMCGNLTVIIDYQGFRRDYTRSCSWGPTLGELETLLEPPQSRFLSQVGPTAQVCPAPKPRPSSQPGMPARKRT